MDGSMEDFVNKKITNNPEIQKFISDHNQSQKLDFDSQLLGGCGAIFGREEYILMLQLGVPIGVVEYRDSKDNLLIEEWDEPIGDIRHIYKPINSIKEYVEYQKINYYPDVMVNPSYMTKKEVRNLAYCLRQANNDSIFDFDTKNKLQFEIINSVPLKYDEAMEIFNKYFDKSIQNKFIKDYGVERDRFYYLSGLNELIPPSKDSKTKERDER